MQHLQAPWRIQYILEAQSKKQPKGCLLCRVGNEHVRSTTRNEDIRSLRKKNLVLFVSRHAFVMMNKYPYNSGHLMVVPRRHVKDFTKLTAAEHKDLDALISLSLKVLKKVYKPHGFNIGMNLERAAGAGIPNHLHYHIVPRWNGDNNFMPVLANTKVMIEYLDAAYEKLKKEFSVGRKSKVKG